MLYFLSFLDFNNFLIVFNFKYFKNKHTHLGKIVYSNL